MNSKFSIAVLWLLSIGATFLVTKYWLEQQVKNDKIRSAIDDNNKRKDLKADSCMDVYFKDFPYDADSAYQAQWLENEFDSDLELAACDCVKESHKMFNGKTQFDGYVADYWGTDTPVYTEISIKTIKDLYFNKLINYDNYIAFRYDEVNKKVVASLATDYLQQTTCYSIPLFESIYKEDKNALLECTKGTINHKTSIIFSIKKTTDGYFDYSQIPTLHGDFCLKMAY